MEGGRAEWAHLADLLSVRLQDTCRGLRSRKRFGFLHHGAVAMPLRDSDRLSKSDQVSTTQRDATGVLSLYETSTSYNISVRDIRGTNGRRMCKTRVISRRGRKIETVGMLDDKLSEETSERWIRHGYSQA